MSPSPSHVSQDPEIKDDDKTDRVLERPLVSSVKSHSTYSLDNHLESVEIGSEDKYP